MLARLVHHTDDLQRLDAPLIALVTESALTVGQAGVELSFRSHRPTTLVGFRSPPAAARNGAGSVPRRRVWAQPLLLRRQCFSDCHQCVQQASKRSPDQQFHVRSPVLR